MKLSIVILNYKTKHLLRLAIKNLLELDIPVEHEIIIVDNASEDGSVEMVEELYSESVTLIANPENTGHAHGNNIGFKVATGEYILVLNSDIIFLSPDDVMTLVDYMDEHKDVGLLGPKLRNGNGTVQLSCFRPYGNWTPLYRRTPLGKLGFAQRDLNRHLMIDFDHNITQEVEWILGASMLIRKEALDKVGYFNELFFLYFADYELCDRLRFHGYKVIYYADAKIVHYHRRESAQRSIWGGLGSVLNYTTRIHVKDWLTYKRIAKQGYGTGS